MLCFDNASTLNDVLDEAQVAEQAHQTKSVSRKYMKKLEPLVKGIERYGEALDVLTSVKPQTLGFLCGSARMVLLVSHGFH